MNSLSQKVKRQLILMIQDGTYASGALLPSEMILSKNFGVSRPVIREALASLSGMGFIKLSKGRPPMVLTPSFQNMFEQMSQLSSQIMHIPEGVLHFEQMRLMFECWLGAYAAKNSNPTSLKHLRDALEENGKDTQDNEAFFHSDIHFHRKLAEICANPILIGFHKMLLEWIIITREKYSEQDNKESYREHQKIFQSICDALPRKTYRLMEAHIYKPSRLYQKESSRSSFLIDSEHLKDPNSSHEEGEGKESFL